MSENHLLKSMPEDLPVERRNERVRVVVSANRVEISGYDAWSAAVLMESAIKLQREQVSEQVSE